MEVDCWEVCWLVCPKGHRRKLSIKKHDDVRTTFCERCRKAVDLVREQPTTEGGK